MTGRKRSGPIFGAGRLVAVLMILAATGLSPAGAQTILQVPTTGEGRHLVPGERPVALDQMRDVGAILEEGHARMARLLKQTGRAASPAAPVADRYEVGDRRTFWSIDFTAGFSFPYQQYELEAVCRAVGDYAYYFVEADRDTLAQWIIDDFLSAFEQATPGSPRNPDKGIFENTTEVFGDAPQVDGDPKLIILFLNIRDGATTRSQPYIGGYFYSVDQSADPVDFGGGIKQRSNFTDMLYVDIFPADPTSAEVKSTIAHELQHLIQWNNNPHEITAVNEGFSEYASYINGFGLRSMAPYVSRPQADMLSWRRYGTAQDDYSRVALWTYYLGTRFGDDTIRAISLSTLSGESGINAGLAPSGTTFAQVLHDFAAWLYLDDPTVDDGRYGARPLRPWIEPAEHENLYPARHRTRVEARGVNLIRFWNASDFELTFPEGIPSGVRASLAIKGPAGSTIHPLTSAGRAAPELGTTHREGALVLTNDTGQVSSFFRVEATAAQGDTGLVRYEAGRRAYNIGAPSPTAGWEMATRLRGEVAPYRLTGIWIYYGNQEAAQVAVRLMTPIEGSDQWVVDSDPIFQGTFAPPFTQEGWLYVPVSHEGTFQQEGVEYLVSIAAGSKVIGYAEVVRERKRSYLNRGSGIWEPLSNFQITMGGSPVTLDGDWMIRGEFVYQDETSPTVVLGLLQHPLFPTQADVYVLGSEPLHPGRTSGTLQQTGIDPLPLLFRRTLALASLVDPSPVLNGNGDVTLSVTAWDRYGGHSIDQELTIGLASPLAGQRARLAAGSAGEVVVEIPAGQHPGGTLTLTSYAEIPEQLPTAPGGGGSVRGAPVVMLGPESWPAPAIGARLYLPVQAADEDVPLRLERWTERRWEPVAGGAVRIEGSVASGRIPGGGWYRLAYGTAPPASGGESTGLEVMGNAPNPFNSSTEIRFVLPAAWAGEPVRVTVLNVRGQQVRVLADGPMGAGQQVVRWHGDDSQGRPAASGIYLYRIEVAGTSVTRKMLLLR